MGDRCIKSVPVPLNNPSTEKSQDLCTDYGHCLAVYSEEIGVIRRQADKSADAFSCIRCGQCAAVCPERAVRGKSHWGEVVRTVNGPQKIAVLSITPSVRVGSGECFGGRPGDFMGGCMVSAPKELGTDCVLDVAFSVDLTITEEGAGLLRHFLTGSHSLPQSTGCCLAQVRYVETFHPGRIGCLSSAKGPINIQETLIKTHFAREQGIDLERIVSVAVTFCTAERLEMSRGGLYSSEIYQGISGPMDNDYVLTTRGLAEQITGSGIEFYSLDPSSFGSLMGEGSRAGMTFDNMGGIIEVTLRMAYSVVSGKRPVDLLLKYRPVRGLDQVKETVMFLGEWNVRAAVIYGIRAVEQLTETGNTDFYDFVGVITYPGGCISGGGRPDNGVLPVPDRLRMERIKSLYRVDEQRIVRSSLDNRGIRCLYERFLGEPMGEPAQTLLHTCYHGRKGGK